MRNLKIILILTVFFMPLSASATLADCPTCGGQPDWTASATAFLEGKPINDISSGLSGPQQARLLNAQIDAQKKANQASKSVTSQMMTQGAPISDINLTDVKAVPNPANSTDTVEIVAVFGKANATLTTSRESSKEPDLAHLTVYAEIKNLAGLNVGKINLKPSSGNAYSGNWKMGVGPGTYNASIRASESNVSRIFNNALQVDSEKAK